jgi:hypothetical protein
MLRTSVLFHFDFRIGRSGIRQNSSDQFLLKDFWRSPLPFSRNKPLVPSAYRLAVGKVGEGGLGTESLGEGLIGSGLPTGGLGGTGFVIGFFINDLSGFATQVSTLGDWITPLHFEDSEQ